MALKIHKEDGTISDSSSKKSKWVTKTFKNSEAMEKWVNETQFVMNVSGEPYIQISYNTDGTILLLSRIIE